MLCCNVATKPNRFKGIWLYFVIIRGSEDMLSIFTNVNRMKTKRSNFIIFGKRQLNGSSFSLS